MFVVFFVNTITATYFIQFTLAGIVFLSFVKTLDKEYYFSFFAVILSFLIIESNQGLQVFSLSLYSLILYGIVIPYLDKVFTIEQIRNVVHLVGFYVGLCIWLIVSNTNYWDLLFMIFINAIVDLILVGILL